jgi:hypothetical protein
MDDVLFIYNWFKKSMISVGRKMSDPRCTDIKKTYQYRTVSKFVDKARGCGLNRNQMQALIKEIVKYGRDHKILYRGTAILNMTDVFAACGKRIEMNVESADMVVESIRSSVAAIGQNEPLHKPENLGGYPRMISAIDSGILPVELLALSRRCITAVHKLNHTDRKLLPSDGELLKIRIRLLMDKSNRDKLKDTMGDDLVETGVPA